MADSSIPVLLDAPPAGDMPTDYDWQHRISYLRLLDADAEGADWQDVARLVLKLDPVNDPVRARQTWLNHLERARWMSSQGHQDYLQDGADERRQH